ncbi:histidinol-phosphatase [Rhodovulum sulfidophilum]|uniref:Histidinol-phosphatase n=1 Tax=Rhodovulum visakhapatnamense TaxID=364297 RepID=A0ABS1RBK5_9RHOB|nr:histidinol-phosphatase [Rhodovulum visakhapatnamense]MBL3570735.1 histidinol-phosphatase [Rhodovulum visakhapatnamense]MBL3576874.1 histidinol-phosphatase [Rhodovulum visakhapatnamense]OLS43976.1 histidinol-phosphatase [Rhodovulum sulfidophilum]
MKDTEADSLIEIAHALADAARTATLSHFRTATLGVENKAGTGFDPVTRADRASEAAMRAILADRRPEDGVLGEELDGTSSRSGLTWVLDPIDGTRGFVCGTPTWGVLVALSDADGPILGIIDQPYIGERLLGGFGRAEFSGPHGQRRLATSAPRPLSQASVFSTFPEVGTPEERRAFAALAGQAQMVRYGMDCYAYALVAMGHVDLVVEAGLHAYDIQAPIAVIEAAGGIVTDWKGGPAHDGGRVVAAANASIHAEALAILSAAA